MRFAPLVLNEDEGRFLFPHSPEGQSQGIAPTATTESKKVERKGKKHGLFIA